MLPAARTRTRRSPERRADAGSGARRSWPTPACFVTCFTQSERKWWSRQPVQCAGARRHPGLAMQVGAATGEKRVPVRRWTGRTCNEAVQSLTRRLMPARRGSARRSSGAYSNWAADPICPTSVRCCVRPVLVMAGRAAIAPPCSAGRPGQAPAFMSAVGLRPARHLRSAAGCAPVRRSARPGQFSRRRRSDLDAPATAGLRAPDTTSPTRPSPAASGSLR